MARESRGKLLLVTTVLVLLVRQTFAAPIRAYVPALWYIPDLLLGLGVLAFIYLTARSKLHVLLWVTLAFVVLITLSLLANPAVAVAVSARQVLYLFMAVLCGYVGSQGRAQINTAVVALAVIAMAGVFIDFFVQVPWANARFSGALNTVDVAREWWDKDGERRLAGFGLASTDTSVIIAAGILVMLGQGLARFQAWRLVVFALAVYAIYLTTQRSTALAFSVVSLLLIVASVARAVVEPATLVRLLKVTTIVALITAVLAPMFLYGANPESWGITAPTLRQRTSEVWPSVITFLLQSPQTLLGYGFGSAGDTAQVEQLQLVDNAFLYTTLNFGLAGALAMFGWAGLAVVRARIWDAEDVTALAVICLCAINGITANVIASGGVATLYAGIAIGILSRPRRRSQLEERAPAGSPIPKQTRVRAVPLASGSQRSAPVEDPHRFP